MKKISLLILACALPAGLFAQPEKRQEVKWPEPLGAPGAAAAPVKKESPAAAPAVPAAEIIPVKASAPAAAKSTAAAKKISVPKAAAGGAGQAKSATLPPAQAAAAGSKLISPELVAAAGITPEALQAGGFVVGRLHTVVKGDTLWDLSGRYYKDPFLWGKIYDANNKTVANPDRIHPLEELIIPEYKEVIVPFRAAAAAAPVSAQEHAEYTEVLSPAAPSAWPAAAAPGAGAQAPGELLADLEGNSLSEEMPVHQKEWSDGMKIVPDGWREDGVITGKPKGDEDNMDDSLSLSGEAVEIKMYVPGLVKPGDYLAVYLKGGDAYDKAGKKLGRELQPAGLAEVTGADGDRVSARVLDATTAISKGYIVKKK